MSPIELKALLSGYAAGTLTAEERELLFRAALEDQELFDALAGEEALRELLADPGARAQLLVDLRETPQRPRDRASRWLWRPATLAFAGGAAGLVLIFGVARFVRPEPPPPKLVAQAPAPESLSPRAAAEPGRKPPAAPRPRETEEAPPAAAAALRDRAAAARPVAQPSALSYTVQVRGPEGEWRDTAPGALLRGGDQVRLRVRPAEDGYVSVGVVDRASITPLTPVAGVQTKAGQDLFIPASGGLELEGESGEKSLRLTFSQSPLPAPAAALRFTAESGAPAAAKKSEPDAERRAGPRVVDIHLRYGPR